MTAAVFNRKRRMFHVKHAPFFCPRAARMFHVKHAVFLYSSLSACSTWNM